MKFKGLRNISGPELKKELDNGAKFVVYTYAVSIILMTFKRSSDVYFIKSNETGISKGIPFTIISLLFGWWGIPWGPIYTIGSLVKNFQGGKDITPEVLQNLHLKESTQKEAK